jgi:hypothetical protein
MSHNTKDVIISTFFVLLFAIGSLILNETIYTNNDPQLFIAGTPGNCEFALSGTNVGAPTLNATDFDNSDDTAREMLYGVYAARGSAIATIGLGVVALIVGYKKWDTINVGAKLHIEVLNLVVSGALLATTVFVLTTFGSLLHQGPIPSGVEFDMDPCKDADHHLSENVVDRVVKLRISVLLGLATLFSILFMGRELREYTRPEAGKAEAGKAGEGV